MAEPNRAGSSLRERLRAAWRALRGGGDAASDDAVSFRCNVCGQTQRVPRAAFGRETGLCAGCGSTVRMRAMMHALVMELFGTPCPLPEVPPHTELRGLGLSDWEGYASRLAERLAYENTYYHQEPRVDICAPPADRLGRYDFCISSDVFEHVPPPAQRAFDGAAALLQPGGLLVLSVPYSLDASTREHFPELHTWHLEERAGARVLVNETVAGERQEFSGLCFHGGAGETLEMRVFCERDLLAHLRAAGFVNPRIWRDDVPEFGIYWTGQWSLPITARRSPSADPPALATAPAAP